MRMRMRKRARNRDVEQLKAIKAAHESELMNKANVVGVAVGLRQRRGALTSEPAIVVSVTHKVPSSELASEDVIPSTLDGVPVDVQALGQIRAL
jgi:hypothetical protein